jgi:hypothetical protein
MTLGESGVAREDAAIYRLYAVNCVELAQQMTEPERRLFLLKMAKAWTDLADRTEDGYRSEPAQNRDASPTIDRD